MMFLNTDMDNCPIAISVLPVYSLSTEEYNFNNKYIPEVCCLE